MVEVIATDEMVQWYERLDEADAATVYDHVAELARRGVALGYPRSSAVRGSRHALRELRVQSGGKPLRVFYAFDPRRDAVLLIGGDKTGESDDRFYDRMVPRADDIFDQYLAEQAAGLHREHEED
jgi:hypothetical protein